VACPRVNLTLIYLRLYYIISTSYALSPQINLQWVFYFSLHMKPTLSCTFKRTVSYFLVYQLTLYSIQHIAPNENSATNEAIGSMSNKSAMALKGICPQTLRRILKFLRHETGLRTNPNAQTSTTKQCNAAFGLTRCGAIFAAGCSKVLITRCM